MGELEGDFDGLAVGVFEGDEDGDDEDAGDFVCVVGLWVGTIAPLLLDLLVVLLLDLLVLLLPDLL